MIDSKNHYILDPYYIKFSNRLNNGLIKRTNELLFTQELMSHEYTYIPKILETKYNKDSDIVSTKMIKINDFYFFNEKPLSDEIINKLIKIINLFHNIDIKKIETFDYLSTITNVYKKIKNPIIPIDLNKIKDFCKVLNDCSDKKISHNHLNKKDILINKDNSLIIVNYEYVSINNILFDFAGVVSNVLFNQKDVNQYISRLLGNNILTNENIPLFRNEVKYQDLLWLTWLNYFYEKTLNHKYLEIFNIKKEIYETRILNIN